jgi:hypothetical protein
MPTKKARTAKRSTKSLKPGKQLKKLNPLLNPQPLPPLKFR